MIKRFALCLTLIMTLSAPRAAAQDSPHVVGVPNVLVHGLSLARKIVGAPWSTCLLGSVRGDTAVVANLARTENSQCATAALGIAKSWDKRNALGQCAEDAAERAALEASRSGSSCVMMR